MLDLRAVHLWPAPDNIAYNAGERPLGSIYGTKLTPGRLDAVCKSFKNDLPAFNDDPSWVLPMPARFVMGTDGIWPTPKSIPITCSVRIRRNCCRCWIA